MTRRPTSRKLPADPSGGGPVDERGAPERTEPAQSVTSAPSGESGPWTTVPQDRTAPGHITQERVPVRTILTAIGLVLATALLLLLIREIQRVLLWIVIAAFFATALYPLVNWIQRLLPWCRRSIATLVVFLLVVVLLGGVVAVFAVPLAQEGTALARQLPGLVEDARAGRGPIGHLLDRTHVLEYIQRNQGRVREFVTGLGTPALGFLRSAATGVAGLVTIFVLAFLMVLQGPKLVEGTLAFFREDRAERIRAVGADCAKTITGYISGNLLISVICGSLTYAVLLIVGVPFAGLIALFVAIADLIPLVGATLGAVVAGLAAFVHSVPAGIVVVVFFVLYQQFENHLLQPLIFARTVKLNPLTVLTAILIAVELAGFLGALLAIPMAGMIQIIVRDVWYHRHGRLKPEPTVGEDHTPVPRHPTP
ncbi:MAG TPA: AI-2E family transporter [Streptosporangiaceae bacterium]